MRRHFKELVRIVFKHDYFEDTSHPFTFVPQEQTKRLLQRAGLLFRSQMDGFTIRYPAIRTGSDTVSPLRKLPEKVVLRFWVCATDPHTNTLSQLPLFRSFHQNLYFDNLTDRHDGDNLYLNSAAPTVKTATTEDIVAQAPQTWRYSESGTEGVFVRVQNGYNVIVRSEWFQPQNDQVQGSIILDELEPGILRITTDPQHSEIYYKPESTVSGIPFAAIDLYAGSMVPETYAFIDSEGLPQPKTFLCHIAKRRSIWRYIVIPKFSTNLNAAQLSIEDADEKHTFTAAQIVSTMAGETAFAIASESVISHQVKPLKGLVLRRNSVDLIKELPNPRPDQIVIRDDDFYAEMYVYV